MHPWQSLPGPALPLKLLDPATGGLLGTAQVSRYPVQVGAPLNDGEQASDILMLRQDPLVRAISDKSNAPSSGGGTTPFYGDYLSVVPTATFVLDRVTGRWRWAITCRSAASTWRARTAGT